MQFAEQLLSAIQDAVKEYATGQSIGILFSGGLDSTVIAKVAADYSTVSLYTIGTEGSHDLSIARVTAKELDLDWTPIVLDSQTIIANLLPLSRILRSQAPLPLSYEMPLFVVAQVSNENTLMSGQGADELFGGYSRYLQMDDEQLAMGMKRDLEVLLSSGVEREHEIASNFHKQIFHPYLHSSVIRVASHLPLRQCVDGKSRKVVLTEVARLLGLKKVAERPKKAAQYGSGVMKAMKAEARRLDVDMHELVPTLEENWKRTIPP